MMGLITFLLKTPCCLDCTFGPHLLPFSRTLPKRHYQGLRICRNTSTMSTHNASDVLEFLDSLKNYEKLGVPQGAGTDSVDGFDLGRMRRLLDSLGNPLSHYPVLHIAGTKGKGSTAAFISSILHAHGYSVGCYTSPHIQTIHERICVGKFKDPISPSAFQKLFQDNRDVILTTIASEKGLLSHFEVLTALAFKYFADVNVDMAVIETGLGGARDATNVISSEGLLAAIITNVGEEHLTALGGSIESIALAKSGIIKQGRPVIIGSPLDRKLESIMYGVAASKNASVIQAYGKDVTYHINKIQLEEDGVYMYCDISTKRDVSKGNHLNWQLEKSIRLQMIGQHQLVNAMTAVCTMMCLRDQGWNVSDSAICFGLERAYLPGRFHVLPIQVARKLGCQHSHVVLDGAHTAGSAKVLGETLRMVFPKDPLIIVVAIASDKNHYEFAMQLLSYAAPKVIIATETLVAGHYMRSASTGSLAETWNKAAIERGLEVIGPQNLEEMADTSLHEGSVKLENATSGSVKIYQSKSALLAIRKAGQLLSQGVICITGSLHLVSQVLSSVA